MKSEKPISLTLICLLILTQSLTGCKSQKEFLYLADMTDDQGYAITHRYQPRIQRNDKLLISVTCKNPVLAAPFNEKTGSVQVSENGSVSGAAEEVTYKVDNDGYIVFPLLGKIYLAGSTLNEASDRIADLIIEGNYIKDPIVSMEFKNFHYTVLGAANGNGNYTCDGDRVTLLEAIAQAGDLSSNADLGKIAVIREEGNTRKIYTVDIRSTDIFNSPVFYLAQNDVLYVRPKKPKSQGESKFFQWLAVAVSLVSATASVLWITRR